MSSRDKRERSEAMLGELAEHALMVAKDLAVRVRESEDVGETVALAEAFQKVSRVVRLTLALDFKLDRDAVRDAREAEKAQAEVIRLQPRPAPEPHVPTAVEARQDRVRGLLNRLLWNESEGEAEDYEMLLEDLDARLEEAARHPGFETLPIEALARRVIADMGLAAPPFALTLTDPKPAPAREPAPANTG